MLKRIKDTYIRKGSLMGIHPYLKAGIVIMLLLVLFLVLSWYESSGLIVIGLMAWTAIGLSIITYFRLRDEILVKTPSLPQLAAEPGIMPKILDTSSIIDGRILALVENGILEGTLIVPNFVLFELQLLGDSPDASKRIRGRYGLDKLNSLKSGLGVQIEISPIDYTSTKKVDEKLLLMAQELHAKIITVDTNLIKVATLHGIKTMNIHELLELLRTPLHIGDCVDLLLSKSGKETHQAVGHLDDGTMVVVDHAAQFLNKRIRVKISNIHQTTGGCLLFAVLDDTKAASGQ